MTKENLDNTPEPGEQRLAALLRTIDVDAPAPDDAILESIRQRAAAAFDESPVAVQSVNQTNTRPAVTNKNWRSSKEKRRTPMIMLLASRGFAGLVAVASAVVLWLTAAHNSPALSETPFSTVLSELRSASSLQLKVSKEGQSADVWVRAPGLVRWEESPQRYQIAAGSRLWKIDEAENTAVESDSPWFLGPQQQIDLIGLLDIGVSDASRLLDARPVEQATRDGRDCLVYRVALPTADGNLDIEASADAKSLQLLEILAWKSGTKRTGPPLAEMRLVSMNVQVADEKFVVTKSLTEDGRIGKISEAQGIVVLRPMLAKRWTPICRETLLRPGDWLRTELRGANAVKVTFSSDVELTLGPGTLLECISPTEARLHTGMVQALKNDGKDGNKGSDEKLEFTLLGPREGSRILKLNEKLIVRTDRDERLVDVAQTPPWLAGFEGTSNNESLGSLIVTLPDGRNEPLTVGYHKVSVEIRDQIARTTIEESFVNHTPGRLEGVFHFPLPHDASISGFGMWIGNDLIEADVVEKQRAREIYETILREKRDPGLLEWTGGNIFKARVFPIEARSEKRIKIVYTQVLPLRANRYRYAYGLRSELLRTTPLRELSLTVTVNSALALKSVTCPTHTVRIATSGERQGVSPPSATGTERTRRADALPLAFHSAQVEFSAQEYTPTRDFEVVCEVEGRQSDVVVVPHQRGDDGYFLIQLTPPGADGNWQREILPDGEPLQIVLLCDTSMSMDSEKRREQSEFVAAILASLGPDDRFQLVAADVATAWASAEPMAANADNIAAATKFLNDRVSLGWTNLDQAFDDVLRKAPANAHIVYIGDGIVSAGDTDPAAFVKRLQQLASGGRQSPDDRTEQVPVEKTNAERNRNQGVDTPRSPGNFTLHAVSVGNANDAVVMRGIANVGGGSARAISGEQTPQISALELLNEIAQPGLRDLNVEFRGLKVAAVYPERLPNVAAGTQQILVGRYLPEGADQQGEIIVTGKRGSEEVRYAARVNLKDAEEGNSFIPRLWARAHLDQLLAQGGSQTVQDDIIRLSEEFHIITPYTSLLVLETDADRERFGVQRRYEMRDGERFFADGRDNANFDLLQQQMKRAGDWRLGMRRQILSSLAGLGRDANAFQQNVQRLEQLRSHSLSRGTYPMSEMQMAGGSLGDYDFLMSDGVSVTGGFGGSGGFRGGLGLNDSLSEMDFSMPMDDRSSHELSSWNFMGRQEEEKQLEEFGESDRKDSLEKFDVDEDLLVGLADKKESFGRRTRDFSAFESLDGNGDYGLEGLFDGRIAEKAKVANTRGLSLFVENSNEYYNGRYDYNQPDYTSWVNTLFPALGPAAGPTEPVKDPEHWSPEAIALANSLLRTDALLALDGGIEMHRDTEHMDPRWNRSSGRSIDQVLYSPTAWLTRGNNIGEQTLVNYCDANEHSIYSQAFHLGRSRESAASELKLPPLSLNDFSLSPLQRMYANWNVAIEPAGDNQVLLNLTMKDTANAVRFTIDTARHVLLKHEVLNDGKVTNTTSFDDFVELAGTWWARRIVLTNDQEQVLSDTQLNFQARTKDEYAQRLQQLLADKPTVQFVREPFVTLKQARQRVADGAATFDDRLAMILHNAQIQQWDEMWKHVDAAEKLAVEKSGVRWIRTVLLATIRRNEEARQRLTEEAQRLAPVATPGEVFLAEFILGHANTVSSTPEFYAVHQLLKPVYARPLAEKVPAIPQRWPNDNAAEQGIREAMAQRIMEIWNEREASSQERMGRSEDVLQLRRAIAESMPWNVYSQQDYANRLQTAGQPDEALAWLRQELARPQRNPYDDDVLRTAVADLFRNQSRWDELQKWTTEWIARNPETNSYYSAYAHHLAALVFNDQLDAAYAVADQWLREGRVEGKMTMLQQMRFDAALNFANGQVPNLNFQRVDERWFAPLAETARFFVRHPHHFDIVSRCTSNYYFGQSDVADQLRGEWLTLLRNEGATLSAAQWSALVGWTLSGRLELTEPIDDRKQLDATEVPDSVWEQISATLKQRWLQAEDKDQKRLLSEALVTVYASRFRETKLLPFLRERIAAAINDDKPAYIAVLFENLLTTAWSHEIETEALVVLQQLSPAANASEQLTVELPALYRLVDAMLANRIAAGEKLLHDQGELDKLTRQELAERNAEIRKTARTALAARLSELARGSDAPMAAWFRIEQLWLDVQHGQNLVEAETACWQILGNEPPKLNDENAPDDADADPAAEEELSVSEQAREFFDVQLKRRAFATVMNLTVRSKAPAESVERLLKYVDAGIANGGDSAIPWRQVKFRLLIALDRADDLERELREWIRIDVSTASWRQILARLLAERGKLDEAIQLFEACEKDKLLTASDYRQLSDWYLVSNRRGDYERSRIESFKQLPEDSLQQMLYQTQNHWSRADIPLPSELNDDTLFALRALFEKSAAPESYFYQVQALYGACRDFRLPQMVPDAMLGRSPQQVYSFLQGLQNYVLAEIRNEATADEILVRVNQLREGERTVTDLRALDLLEALIERKSSELLNQPGPHIDACLAAMQRGYQREWADGEPRMMATFLFQLGALPNEKMKAEQLRELRELRNTAAALSRDHLSITMDLCQLLFVSYGERDEALRQMEIEVRDYTQANKGTWPFADNEILSRYVTLLEAANRHAVGEQLLQKFIAQPANAEQTKWLKDRMMSLYNNALEHDGAVSIGTGRVNLFAPIVALSLAELDAAPDENVRYTLVTRLTGTFDTAHRHQLAGTKEAVQKFAFATLPAVLKRQQQQYRSTATHPLQLMRDVLDARMSLQYVVERMEQYPQRFETQYDNSWNAFGYEVSARRAQAGSTDLDARILKLTIARLEFYLHTGESNHFQIFYNGYDEFWKEKAAEFAATAERILNERRSSGRRAMTVAQYFRNGLSMVPRAIEILHIAHGNGILNESEQYTLVTWLRETNRFAEMIPILEPLVKHHPDSMQYRIDLMAAWFHTQRLEQLQTLITQTITHFHAGGRWTEGNVGMFATGFIGVGDWTQARQYFTEAIAQHQRANPGSGLNDNTLSQYYQNLASAESALGNTKEAVTAAMSSIVCWDARHEYRTYALNALSSAVHASKDLDAFVAQLDAEAAQSGQDNPILRKAIGQTYQSRNEHRKAIAQFNLALELQPNDKETHQALIVCWDAVEDKAAASSQLLDLIDLQRHDLTLYQQLATRMSDNPLEAERAATSIIESSPNEAESHAAMAELRQTQNRWAEAIPHWEQVARFRKLEPTGLLKLVEAQIHEKRFTEAKQTLQTLKRTAWPSRFGDVESQIRQLEEQVPKE